MTDAIWTGTVDKGPEPNTVVVVVRETWGWEITLHGTLQAGGGYACVGEIGPAPECLRVPSLDGEGG